MKLRAALLTALACLILCSCDVRSPFDQLSPPAPETFTAATVWLTVNGTTESTAAAIVKQDFFKPYSVLPLIGRRFVAEDYHSGGRRRVLLSEDLWRRKFSAAPDIIGSEIDIDGAKVTVIGVLPKQFDVPLPAKLWLNRGES